jgi:membrane protein DedA with SNARE-associated domain
VTSPATIGGVAMASVVTASWVVDAIRTAGYPALVALMVAENLFPPIPSEVVLPLAGYEVSRGHLNFAGVLLCATLGSVLGALLLYAAGRRGGKPLIARHGHRLRIRDEDLDRAEDWFGRRGALAVFGARLVPGARSLISVPAGTLRMPLVAFTALTTLGSAIWNAVLIGAGVVLADQWQQVSDTLGPLGTAVVAVLVVVAVLLTARFVKRRRRQEQRA